MNNYGSGSSFGSCKSLRIRIRLRIHNTAAQIRYGIFQSKKWQQSFYFHQICNEQVPGTIPVLHLDTESTVHESGSDVNLQQFIWIRILLWSLIMHCKIPRILRGSGSNSTAQDYRKLYRVLFQTLQSLNSSIFIIWLERINCILPFFKLSNVPYLQIKTNSKNIFFPLYLETSFENVIQCYQL